MRDLLRQLKFRSEWMLSSRVREIYNAEPDRAVLEELKWKIAAGPFAGMRYITRSCGSKLAPKLIGCYERELHPAIEQVIAENYQRIIDIGCAEGYYAVGLAWKTNLPVVAFDTNPDAHTYIKELAELNEVTDLVEIQTTCDRESLKKFAQERVFLICDIEGGEAELLDPAKSPALLNFDLLVEVHEEPAATQVHDLLVERFQATHTIETIPYQGRSAEDAAKLSWITNPDFKLAAVEENRERGLEWLLMKRNA